MNLNIILLSYMRHANHGCQDVHFSPHGMLTFCFSISRMLLLISCFKQKFAKSFSEKEILGSKNVCLLICIALSESL